MEMERNGYCRWVKNISLRCSHWCSNTTRDINGALHPNVNYKYLNISGTAYKGAGADLQYNFTDKLNVYAGYSTFEKQREYVYEPEKNIMHNAEIKLRAKYPQCTFEWNAFYSKGNKLADSSVMVNAYDESGTRFVNANDEPVTGTGLSLIILKS